MSQMKAPFRDVEAAIKCDSTGLQDNEYMIPSFPADVYT